MIVMRINRIENSLNFNSNETDSRKKTGAMDFVIDSIEKSVRNQRDINDCVSVPRGIFKAYIALMAGTGLIGMSSFIPKSINWLKQSINIIGCGLNILSAYYFAKPFAFKGNAPTVQRKTEKGES